MSPRTWETRDQLQKVWTESHKGEAWLPFGVIRLDQCGCVVDTFNKNKIWRPCMAHEAEGHLSAVSESDGVHVARCLVLSCRWTESRLWENDAIEAAQGHWRDTRTQAQQA